MKQTTMSRLQYKIPDTYTLKRTGMPPHPNALQMQSEPTCETIANQMLATVLHKGEKVCDRFISSFESKDLLIVAKGVSSTSSLPRQMSQKNTMLSCCKNNCLMHIQEQCTLLRSTDEASILCHGNLDQLLKMTKCNDIASCCNLRH